MWHLLLKRRKSPGVVLLFLSIKNILCNIRKWFFSVLHHRVGLRNKKVTVRFILVGQRIFGDNFFITPYNEMKLTGNVSTFFM